MTQLRDLLSLVTNILAKCLMLHFNYIFEYSVYIYRYKWEHFCLLAYISENILLDVPFVHFCSFARNLKMYRRVLIYKVQSIYLVPPEINPIRENVSCDEHKLLIFPRGYKGLQVSYGSW